jgi:ribosomal protein S18 acetylase RimI-like enzyme
VAVGGHNEPMEVSIRQARIDDCPDVAALHLRTALFAYTSIFPSDAPRPKLDDLTLDWERRLGGLHSPNVRGYVAARGDHLAGVVVAGADPDHLEMGHITRFYVDAPDWGQGIGSLLYDAAISHLRQVGYVEASLWVLEGNARARAWYERLGWTCTGECKVAAETVGVEDVRYTKPL